MCNKSGCKWHEILLFSEWKPQGPRQQSHSTLVLHFLLGFQYFGSPPDKFRMLHLVVKSFTHQLFDFMELTLWNMVWKKIINGYYSNTFFYKWQTETKHLSENIHWKKQHQLSFIYQISQTDAQTILLNWLQ